MTGKEFVFCFDPSTRTMVDMDKLEEELNMNEDMLLCMRCKAKVMQECKNNERQRQLDHYRNRYQVSKKTGPFQDSLIGMSAMHRPQIKEM